MKLWFIGSIIGMTTKQKEQVKLFLTENIDKIEIIRHGDTVGAEYEFHSICYDMDLLNKIYIHPLNNRTKRALCKGPNILEPLNFEQRRKILLDNSNYLLATVSNYVDNSRKDCWSLIHMAKDRNIPVLIVFPNGVVSKE